MKRTLNNLILVSLLLLFQGGFSLLSAGQVTLEISTTTGLSQGKIFANFRITNRGTDSALEISVLGKFLEEQQSVFLTDSLAPGQTAEASITFGAPANLQGSYPLFITAYYHHVDGIGVC